VRLELADASSQDSRHPIPEPANIDGSVDMVPASDSIALIEAVHELRGILATDLGSAVTSPR
jgi:hypothetical protein